MRAGQRGDASVVIAPEERVDNGLHDGDDRLLAVLLAPLDQHVRSRPRNLLDGPAGSP
jgi:hypothetical protein